MNIFSAKTKRFFMAISTIIIALIFVGLSIFAIARKDEVTFENVEATIVRIDEFYDTVNQQNEYTVFVDYEVEGVKYKGVEYGAYDSSMDVGDTVTAKYDVDNPEFIEAEGSENVPYIVGGAGFVLAVFGIYMLIKAIREA